jgi:hypothetical protein
VAEQGAGGEYEVPVVKEGNEEVDSARASPERLLNDERFRMVSRRRGWLNR